MSTLRGLPRDRTRARLEAEVAREAFLVGLFHPLPHAGLSRRTKIAIALNQKDLPNEQTAQAWANDYVSHHGLP